MPRRCVNEALTIARDPGRVSTRSSLISFFCFECDARTATTYDWLAEHGVTCEHCYEKIPVDAEELGRGLAAIDLAWGEVDTVVQELNRSLPPVPSWAMPERLFQRSEPRTTSLDATLADHRWRLTLAA